MGLLQLMDTEEDLLTRSGTGGESGTREDLLLRVLLPLDPEDLQNLELSCRTLRTFMIRTQTWKKKFEQDCTGPQSLKEAILKVDQSCSPAELHANYKTRYVKHQEALAALEWKRFCQSWMTIMTISSMYSLLHPESETNEEFS